MQVHSHKVSDPIFTSKFALAHVETVTEHVSSVLTVTLPNGTLVEGIDEHNARVAAKLIESMS